MILSGKQLAKTMREQIREEVNELIAHAGRRPCLSIIKVGNDPASTTYVQLKLQATADVGIEGRLIHMPDSCTEQELISEVHRLNDDPTVDSILIQVPLPAHISEDNTVTAILPEKDVDGFHFANVARLWLDKPSLLPCTPKAVLALLEDAQIALKDKHAVIVGCGTMVGRPLGKMLLDRHCNVTMVYPDAPNLADICYQADILVSAVDTPHTIKRDYVKPGAAVIDAGFTYTKSGACGDVDFNDVKDIAGYITPSPGGVGPMLITMLMRNVLECYANPLNSNL